jgi:hypothetical protein
MQDRLILIQNDLDWRDLLTHASMNWTDVKVTRDDRITPTQKTTVNTVSSKQCHWGKTNRIKSQQHFIQYNHWTNAPLNMTVNTVYSKQCHWGKTSRIKSQQHFTQYNHWTNAPLNMTDVVGKLCCSTKCTSSHLHKYHINVWEINGLEYLPGSCCMVPVKSK